VSLKKGIPGMAAARVQRWCVELSAYNYEVRYRPADKQGNVDALSRLPLSGQGKEMDNSTDEARAVNMIAISSLPITAKQIAHATRNDPVMSRILHFLRTGWPDQVATEWSQFHRRRTELSIEEDCVLWGTRVVVPEKYRGHLLGLLHEGHPGIVKMKSVARMHCWWPNLDQDIEEQVKGCTICRQTLPVPAGLTNNWAWPATRWSRIHMDFAQFKGDYFLIVVDAHSKWPEVIYMRDGTSAKATIDALRAVFGRRGLPHTIVSDNGPPFPSCELKAFCQQNGIKQVFAPPYHPKTNGEAERFVRTFKEGMTRRLKTQANKNLCLHEFLLTYRSTPHSTTGKTPAEMLLGYNLRTKLDVMKPDLKQSVLLKNPGAKEIRRFEVGERVIVQDYRSRKPQWMEGVILSRLSPVTYSVEIPHGEDFIIWKRHIDQMRRSGGSTKFTPIENNVILDADTALSFSDVIVGAEGSEKKDYRDQEQPPTEPRQTGSREPVDAPRPCEAVPAADVVLPRRSSRERRLPSYLRDGTYEL
jgi:transposase InsO family protein